MRYLTFLSICLILLTSCGAPSDGSIAQQPSPTTQLPSPTTQPSSPSPGASAAPSPTLVATQPAPTDAPSPTAAPTAEPSAAPSPTTAPASERDITLDEPTVGATVSNSITIKGETNYWPFEANLTAQLKDASGKVLAIIPVTVNAPDIGQGGPFETQMTFTPPAQPQEGTLEVFEASAKDGSIVAIETVKVQLIGGKPSSASGLLLDAPVQGQSITLPLHVAFRGAQPNETLTGRLRFGNGQVLEQAIPVVTGSDNIGYGVANIDWSTESQPPAVPPGITTFELLGADGTVRQSVEVRLLAENETQLVEVAWTTPEGNESIFFTHEVQRTPQIATAALNELLYGPPDGNAAGAVTALPTVKDIVTFPGRQSDWGYEVKLIKLTITNGVATANFSKEMRAYGGGSARVQAIRQQIEGTLKRFKSVQSVVIQIEGQSTGELQP